MRRRTGLREPVGYHDLLRDLEAPGCPVCRGASRAAWRYIDSILWEYVNDPEVRARLRSAHGFCQEHTAVALEVAAAQAAGLGMALLYADFLRHLRDEAIQAARAGGRRGLQRRSAADPGRLTPHARCPACESAWQVAHNYLRVLAQAEADSEVGRAARRESRTLCLPHLAEGLRRVRSAEEAERLLQVYLRGEAEVRADLGEFVVRQDYRRIHEPPGRERDAWRRAAWLVAGRPPGPPDR